MAGVEGPLNTGQIDALQKAGIDFSPGSSVGKTSNGLVVTIVDPTLTEGLRGEKTDHEGSEVKKTPSIKERVIAKAEDHQTHSIRKRKLIPKGVQKKASQAKEYVSSKAHSFAEFATNKAQALKSLTLGNLLRSARHENWKPIPEAALKDVKSDEFKQLAQAHNDDLETLGELKQQLKAEDREVKDFETKYKDALELLNNPDKFTGKSKKTVFIQTPDGERKIQAVDAFTRGEMVKQIADDIRGSEEFQKYEALVLARESGGTETFRTREELKSTMKTRAGQMLKLQESELEAGDSVTRKGLQSRRENARTQHDKTIQTSEGEQSTQLDEAKTRLTRERKELGEMREDRASLKEGIQNDKKEARRLEKDAVDTRSLARKSRSTTTRSQHLLTAHDQEKAAGDLRKGVDDSEALRSQLKDKVSDKRAAKNKTRQEVSDLESGKALEKTKKNANEALKAEEKQISKEEKELEEVTRAKMKKLKSQLGRKRL